MEKVASVSVPETFVPGGWVVGGKTRLLDVWTASNIVYWSPPFLYRSHKLDFSLRHERCLPPEDRLGRRGKMKKWMRRNRAPRRMGDSVILFDTRHDTSANVAHILQNQIGVLLTGLAALGIETSYRDVTFIIHSDAPSYASRLFETLGFRTVENSYDTFEGSRLEMQPSRLPLLSFSGTALRAHAQSIGILDESDEKKGAVFLARRGRRGLANQDEIELLLFESLPATILFHDFVRRA